MAYLANRNVTLRNSAVVASTLAGSTLTTGSVGFSTLIGSTVTLNTATTGSFGFSTLTGSTATLTNTVTSGLSVSTLVGSTLSLTNATMNSLSVTSTMISIGPNTQSTMVGASNGSYASGSWSVTKSGLVNPKKLAVSSTGQYQLVVSEATGGLWLSSDSGLTWSALGASQGLPVLEGSAQWVAGTISASGQQITLAVSGGSLWFSSDYGRTFAVSPQDTPDVWVPLNGSVSDLMGSSTVTATGSPGYVNVAQPGFTGQAIQLKNTAGGTATQYVRGTIGSLDNFTVSFWMNMSSYSTTTNVQVLSFHNILSLYLNTAGQLNFFIPSSGGTGTAICGISSTFASNTWYYVSATFQTNGLCSFYINNTLIGSYSNVDGYGTFSKSGYYGIGTFSSGDPPIEAFDGLIADFRLYNRAVTYSPLPHLAPAYWLRMEGSVADAGSYSLVNTATPFISCAFDGVLTDAQGNSTVTAPGLAVSYVASVPKGVASSQSLALVNTAGGTADRYVRGTLNASSNITISFWFNPQTINGTLQTIFDTPMDIALYIGASNHLFYQIPSGGGTGVITVTQTSFTLTANTWYFVTMIFQTNGLCSLFVNNSLIGSSNNTGGYGTLSSSGSFSLGTYDNATTLAFNGYISNFRLHNTAFVQTPSPTLDPTIYLPLEGSVTDERGFSTVTATGSPTYTTSVRSGALGTQAINLANTAGGTATQYVRGTWAGAENFTVSFWFNPQTLNGTEQVIYDSYNLYVCIRIGVANQLFAVVPTGGGTNFTTIGGAILGSNTWYYVTYIFQTDGLCSLYLNNGLIGSVTNTQGLGSLTTTQFSLGSFTNNTLAFNGYIDDFKLWNTAAAPNPGSTIYPTVYLPFEGSVADAQGASEVTATGISSADYTASVRTGATGIRAIHLANTAGGTATKYVTGTWSAPSNFSVSFWFNAQTVNGNQQIIFDTTQDLAVYIAPSNLLYLQIQSNGGPIAPINTSFTITPNTWYYVYCIFQTNSTCSMYVNNALIGTYTNVGGYAPYPSTGTFRFGTYENGTNNAFNGYIDDFRIWNAAVPYVPVAVVNPVGSLTYVPGAVGQTAVYLANEANQSAGTSASNYLSLSYFQSSPITISLWFMITSVKASSVGGIFTFTDSSSTISSLELRVETTSLGSTNVGLTFNQVAALPTTSISSNTWYHVYAIYQPSVSLSYYINGTLIGSLTSSVPASLSSGPPGNANGRIVIGDRIAYSSKWPFVGYIDDFRLYNAAIPYSSLIPANYTHLAMSGNGVYQMVANQTGSQSGRLRLSSDSGLSWALQDSAATPGAWSSLSASYSGKYLTAQSQPVVQPNQSGLVTSMWSQQGVTYTASASSFLGGFDPYKAFDNNVNPGSINSWATAAGAYNVNGSYAGALTTTVQGGVGTVLGEWLQIQTSIPLVLQSYSYSANNVDQLPKNYYIVGSNDGSTWFPIQYVNMIQNPYSAAGVRSGSNININYTGTQNIQGNVLGVGYTTSYSTSTNTYLYFRVIANSVWSGVGGGYYAFSELFLNFIGGSITPNQSGLAAASWSQSGVGWTVTASSSLGASYEAFRAFNNANLPSWATPAGTYTVNSGAYAGSVSTFIQDGIGVVLGEWLQLQGSIPMVLQSYGYTIPTVAKIFKNYYIVGSNDGSTWYPLQYVIMTRNPSTVNNTSTSNNIIMNYSGIQTIQGNQTGEGTTTPYAPYVTQAWQYFRVIITSVWSDPTANLVEIGQFLPIFTAGQNSSSTFGASWVPTLQTGDAFNVTKNLTITSAGTGWAQLPAFTPVSQGVTISCWFTIQSTPALYSRLFDISSTTLSPSQSLHAFFNGDGTVSVVQYYNNVRAIQLVTNILSTSILYNIVWTVDQSGNNVVYVNGASQATGTQQLTIQTYPYFYIGRSNWAADPYPNMTVTDFRMFNRALNAAEVAQLYNNRNYGQPALGPLVTSESGEYVLAANQSVAAVANGYLTNHQISTYTNPLLAGISGPIVDTAVSQTGQNMILVTPSRQNNLYYSRDYGATFNGLTIGSSSLASGLVPLARLPLDGSAVDLQETLSPATGAGTVTYSTSIVKVGSASAFFNNTAGGVPANYLNYTVPPSLNLPSALTIGCWVYQTAYSTGNAASALTLGSNNSVFNTIFTNNAGVIGFFYGTTTSTGGTNYISSSTIQLNTWTHIIVTFSSGTLTLYVNGVASSPVTPGGLLCGAGGGNITNLMIGGSDLSSPTNAFAGYIDDVRIYNSALTAADVLTLYNNGTAVTNDRSWPMVSCSISNDGSYLTATNSAGAVYRLNSNSQGYSLAIGSQAGKVNQAQNAIAIGNQAGVVNQSANSIILNASGSALNTNSSGFFVSPIGTTSGLNMELLGYGADSQVVRSGVIVAPGSGGIYQAGIGPQSGLFLSTAFGTNLGDYDRLNASAPTMYGMFGGDTNITSYWGTSLNIAAGTSGDNPSASNSRIAGTSSFTVNVRNGLTYDTKFCVRASGNVGIGTTNPAANLSIYRSNGWSVVGMYSSGVAQSAAVLFSPTGTLTSSNPQWFIGHKSSNNGPLSFWKYDGSIHQDNSLTITTNGNVGIGITNSNGKLQFSNDLDSRKIVLYEGANNDHQFLGFGVNNNTLRYQINTTTDSHVFYAGASASASTELMRIQGNGRVGIGTNNPGYTLHVIGDIYASGNITGLSDRRFKTNVEPLVGALDGVTALNGYTYFRPDHRPDERQMGLIAQEVETVFPEAITYDKENDRYGVNYNAMIAPLVTAMKEMRAEYQVLVDSLRQEIRDLKQQLSVSI